VRIAFGPLGLAGIGALLYGLLRRRPFFVLLGAAGVAMDPQSPLRALWEEEPTA
jgi:hypothetical protein